MTELHEFRAAIKTLSNKDFRKDGRPEMKPLRKALGQDITSKERDDLWEDHLSRPLDDGMISLMLTAAPCSPFTLTINHVEVAKMRIGEPVKMKSEHVVALAGVSGVDFSYL